MEFFFGVSPLAVIGLVVSVILLIVGLTGPDIPSSLQWIATMIVVFGVAGVKMLVDRNKSKFEAPSFKGKSIEQIVHGDLAGEAANTKWNLVKRVFGGTMMLFALVGAPLLFASVSLPLLLATILASIALGYELVMRP